MLHYEGGEALE